MREIRGILQCPRRQPVHGRRLPWRDRRRRGHQRRRFRPRRGFPRAGRSQGQGFRVPVRNHQAHRVQDHARRPAGGTGGFPSPRHSIRHHRPFPRANPGRRRLRRRSARKDRSRTGWRTGHHRGARHAQRSGEEGRHHGVLLRRRTFRRVYPCLRRQEHDRRGNQWLPEDRKA